MKTKTFYFITPIKKAMARHQIKTGRQLAEKTEGRVSQPTISRLLKFKTGHRAKVEILCEVLGLNIAVIENHQETQKQSGLFQDDEDGGPASPVVAVVARGGRKG